MALFSNTLWGVEGSASQGSEPGTFSSPIPVVTAALQPLNHKEEVPDPVPGVLFCPALLEQGCPSRTHHLWKLPGLPPWPLSGWWLKIHTESEGTGYKDLGLGPSWNTEQQLMAMLLFLLQVS